MDYRLILKAASFAAHKHCHQRRKGEESSPYINHPLMAAALVAEVGGVEDPEILAAALLHDTLEDTQTTAEELGSLFGERVRSLVEEVSDDKSLPKQLRKRMQIEHAPGLSAGAAAIKLADKICNVTDVTHCPPADWDRERRAQYLDWAESVVLACPRANAALDRRFFEVLAEARSALR